MERMIRRKVQKTGGVSVSITLPKQWVQRAQIKSGDEVILEISDNGSLIIHPPRGEEDESRRRIRMKRIEITQLPLEVLIQKIVASYLNGYNMIQLESKEIIDEKITQQIVRTTNRFIGLELIEQSHKSLLLQDISSNQTINLERFIKRLYKVTTEMIEGTISGIEDKNREKLQSVQFHEPLTDKLYYFISRQLRTYLYDLSGSKDKFRFELSNIIDFERIIKRLEGTGDHCNQVASLALHYLQEKKGITILEKKQVKKIARTVKESYKEVFKAFFMEDTAFASKAIEKSHLLREDLRQEIWSIEKRNDPLAYHFLRFLERLTSYVADIGEATLNIFD